MEIVNAYIVEDKVFNTETKEHIKTSTIQYISDFINQNGFIYVLKDSDESKKRMSFNNLEKGYMKLYSKRVEARDSARGYQEIQNTAMTALVTHRVLYQVGEVTKYGVRLGDSIELYCDQEIFTKLRPLPVLQKNG